jgi:hypothetical protein
VLRSAITMPTRNFFPSSLAPTRSSSYPFLYTTHKCHSSGTALNCQSPNYPPSPDSTRTLLNCNFAQTLHDMPSGLDGGLGHLGHLSHLRHLGHLGHLGQTTCLVVVRIPRTPSVISAISATLVISAFSATSVISTSSTPNS